MDRKPKSTLQTTATSLRIVDTIQREEGATIAELAEELSLAVSTVYKHVATLESNGYLDKTDGTYHIGLRFLNLGEHARNRIPQRQAIDEAVQQLTEETEEEVDFIVEDHGRIITVSESYHKWVKHGQGRSNQYRARTGSYYYMHATASGKAILAKYPRDRIESIVETWGLPRRTENTITTEAELFEELERTRERGYALDDEEYTDGLRSVGMTITRPDGSVAGAMSVSGPSYRLTGDVLRTTIPTAMENVIVDLEAELARSPA